MSAPRSTMPMRIAKSMLPPVPDEYSIATAGSMVVLMNAYSTPPRAPASSGFQNWGGRARPLTPRYTVPGFINRPSLTIALLMQWIVVTYRLPLHFCWNALASGGEQFGLLDRSAALYLYTPWD